MDDPASLQQFAAKCRQLAKLSSPHLSDELLEWADGAEQRAAMLNGDEAGPPIGEPDGTTPHPKRPL